MSLPAFIALIALVSTGISILNVSLINFINLLIFSIGRLFMGIAMGLNSLFRDLGHPGGPAMAGTFNEMYSTVINSNNTSKSNSGYSPK